MKVLEARKEERDLVTATHVCARWREILTSATHLWNKIDFKYPGQLAYHYLEQSKGALIDVTLGEGSEIFRPAEIFVGSTPWVRRMKSLCIQRETEQIREFAQAQGLCQETPNLRSLAIEGKSRARSRSDTTGAGGNIYFPDNFLGKQAPSLQSLTFRSVSPGNIFAFPLPSLTHIDWIAETTYVVFEELLELFASSPRLETIRMHVSLQTHTQGPSKTVTLNNLHDLDWGDHGGSTSLIPCLIAPKLSKLEIRVTHKPQHQWTTLSSILSANPSHIPLLLEPTAVAYVHDHGNRSYHFCYPEATDPEIAYLIVSQVTENRDTDALIGCWFSADLPISFSRTQKLVVEVIGGFPPLDDVPIEKFDSLHELQLIGNVDWLVQILEAKHGKPSPCGTLSKIFISRIDHSSTLRELRKVLEKRNETGHRVKTVQISKGHNFTGAEIEGLREAVDEFIPD